jgi:hypothetical protein
MPRCHAAGSETVIPLARSAPIVHGGRQGGFWNSRVQNAQ